MAILRGYLSAKKITFGVLVIIFLGLISFTFFRFRLYQDGLISVSGFYLGIQKSLDPSTAEISLNQNELTISSKISLIDQKDLEVLAEEIGVDNLDGQDIKIKMGSQTADFINKILINNHLIDERDKSVNLYLRILSKRIDFDNKNALSPFNSSGDILLKNPSLEGSIKVWSLSEDSYYIMIDNPEKVIFEATTSGKLKLSDTLTASKWWQLLSKLAKITLNIDNGVINGSIILK